MWKLAEKGDCCTVLVSGYKGFHKNCRSEFVGMGVYKWTGSSTGLMGFLQMIYWALFSCTRDLRFKVWQVKISEYSQVGWFMLKTQKYSHLNFTSWNSFFFAAYCWYIRFGSLDLPYVEFSLPPGPIWWFSSLKIGIRGLAKSLKRRESSIKQLISAKQRCLPQTTHTCKFAAHWATFPHLCWRRILHKGSSLQIQWT